MGTYMVIKKLWVLQEIFNSTDFIMSEKPDRTSFYTKFIINVMLGIFFRIIPFFINFLNCLTIVIVEVLNRLK